MIIFGIILAVVAIVLEIQIVSTAKASDDIIGLTKSLIDENAELQMDVRALERRVNILENYIDDILEQLELPENHTPHYVGLEDVRRILKEKKKHE